MTTFVSDLRELPVTPQKNVDHEVQDDDPDHRIDHELRDRIEEIHFIPITCMLARLPNQVKDAALNDNLQRRCLGAPTRPELAEFRLRVIERRPGVGEVRRLRLRVDDQATAALRAEELAAVAPALVELQPGESQFCGHRRTGRENTDADPERHAPCIGCSRSSNIVVKRLDTKKSQIGVDWRP